MVSGHGVFSLMSCLLHACTVVTCHPVSCEGTCRSDTLGRIDEGAGHSILQSDRDLRQSRIGTRESQESVLKTRSWDIIEEGGVKFSDVAQGELGTCYFLASLASIAMTRPEIIDQMFVRRELWVGGNPAYTTRWLLNGKPAWIAVDDLIPVNPRNGQPAFVHHNDGADFWPLVLEKTWAKIFGSYKRVDGGTMSEVYKAITQAPIEVFSHTPSADKAELWAAMMEATASRFPMGSGSRANSVSIPFPHAFAISGVQILPEFGQSVYLYNPWAKDRYTGMIPNYDHDDGRFHMTFDEYFEAFHHTTIAKVRKGYTISSKVLSRSAQVTTEALEFEMTGDEPFAVQLEWPSNRFMQECKVLEPRFTMAVSRKGYSGSVVYAAKASPRMSNARADLPGGSGTYQVIISAEFPTGPWLKEIVINAYAAEQTSFRSVNASDNAGQPSDLFLRMHNMCDVIAVRGVGEFVKRSDQPIGGIPTFWAKQAGATKGVLFWNPIVQEHHGPNYYSVSGDNTWKITRDIASARGRSYYPGFNAATDVSCAPSGVQTFSNPDTVQAMQMVKSQTAYVLHDEQGEDWTRSSSAQEKPSLECERLVERLHDLNNARDIKMGSDPLFPPDAQSIGDSDTNCGDRASGRFESCDKYNHWDSFGHIMKGEAFDPHCIDNSSFVDHRGYRCEGWAGNNCSVSRTMSYSLEQLRTLRASCPMSCGLCSIPELEKLSRETLLAPVSTMPPSGSERSVEWRGQSVPDAGMKEPKSGTWRLSSALSTFGMILASLF